MIEHTLRPVAVQCQQAGPVFGALSLHREAVNGVQVQWAAVQDELQQVQAGLPAGAVEAAVQRQAERAHPPAPLSQPPQTSAEWVQTAFLAVQRVQDPNTPGQSRQLNPRGLEQHTSTMRAVSQQLVQRFRQDRGPAVQRYAEYGEHLATLQRQPLTASIVRGVLSQVSPGERPALQRSIDEAVQRQAEQAHQDQAALHVHSLQRQLDELNHDAQQLVMTRIQARRGSGTPLPAAVQRQLEAGLNHDLSSVRIHTDPEADVMARQLHAFAFTTGSDIYFQSGRFEPNTRSGLELLAHEAAHVKQQAGGQAGKGVDPDAGLEAEARTMGAQLAAAWKSDPKRLAPSVAYQHGPRTAHSLTPTTSFQRRAAGTPTPPPPLTIGKMGIIKQADGANVHAQPKASSALIQPQPLPIGTKLGVINQTVDGWSRVSLASGKSGFVQSLRVTTELPDPAATLIRVTGGLTATLVAERYYKGLVKPGQDLRYYVNVLEYLDQQRGTGAFQGGQVLKAGAVLWVPGGQLAQSLVGRVGSGSITGGVWAQARAAAGNGPAANLLRSVMESSQYIAEVLGETWHEVKAHWPLLLATTTALIGAELLVGALAAAPEPTTITKFIAVALQGLITAVAGGFLAVGLAQAAIDGRPWLTTAWTARGDTAKLKVASKAFLGMIGNVVALLSVSGVRASAIKTGQMARLATRETLIAQIGSKATYEALMGTLKTRGMTKNNAQVLGALLNKVPDPLELKGWLRKVDKPTEFLSTLEHYPLNRVRSVLAEIAARSIPPRYASELLNIELENPVPTTALSPARRAFLETQFPKGAADKTFHGKSPVLREELTPAQLAQDELSRQEY